jgi:hypothetical protein
MVQACESLRALLEERESMSEHEIVQLEEIVAQRVANLALLFERLVEHPEIRFSGAGFTFIIQGLMDRQRIDSDDLYSVLRNLLHVAMPVIIQHSEKAFWRFVQAIAGYFIGMGPSICAYIGDLVMIFSGLFAHGFDAVPDAVRVEILRQVQVLDLESIPPDEVADLVPWITFICRLVLSLEGTGPGRETQEVLATLLDWTTAGGDSLHVSMAKLDLQMSLVLLQPDVDRGTEELIASIQRLAVFNYQRKMAIFTLRKIAERNPELELINGLIAGLIQGPVAPKDLVDEIFAAMDSDWGYDDQPVPWNDDDIPDFQSFGPDAIGDGADA